MKKIFITGGTGLLGKDVIPVLAEQYDLFILIRDEKDEIFFQKTKNINFVRGDLNNLNKFENVLKNCDIILHMAGTADPKRSIKVNYELTKKILSVCDKNQKFVFISTFNTTFKNPGEYEISKKMAEKDIQESGMDYLIFRPTLFFNLRGEKYIAKLIRLALKFPVIFQIGDGNFLIQPLFTEDFAKIISMSLDKVDNQIIPIAGKDTVSIKELISMIMEHSGRKMVVKLPLWLLKIIGPFIGINKDKIKKLRENKIMDINNIEEKFGIKLHSIKKLIPNIIEHVKAT